MFRANQIVEFQSKGFAQCLAPHILSKVSKMSAIFLERLDHKMIG
jgi:hypothetical protein